MAKPNAKSPEAISHGAHAIVYATARARVESMLDSIWKSFGPSGSFIPTADRLVLEALMDGVQDAWSEWLPVQTRAK